ncbi:MAG: helix-turn-helix transcriptional regulator [Ferrovibrio sp.]|nr:helix-turn-helix transcriptional regulator [Ferrovibrio sp.]
MTPFGARMRQLRQARGLTLKQMAADLDVSAAYLSALEHGHRGRPSWLFIQRVCGYFNIIWDEAEALADLARRSHPRITIDTSGLSPRATLLANELSARIAGLSDAKLRQLLKLLRED